MANSDMDKLTEKLMGTSTVEKLASKKGDIKKLADTKDAQEVQKLVEKDSAAITKAMKKGDVASLKGALNNILKTEEGARLVKQINDMMKK